MSKTNQSRKIDTRFADSGTFKSHRMFLDAQIVQKPKFTLVVLALVTLIASLGGWYLIRFGKFDSIFSDGAPFPRSQSSVRGVGPVLACLINADPVTALTAGTSDNFFVATDSVVSQYKIGCDEEGISAKSLWSRDFGNPVSALHYVSGKKALDGMLLVAAGNKIETVNPNQSEGNGTVFAELDADSFITAIATDSVSVFAADFGKKCVHRFDMLGAENLTIGQADETAGFEGLSMGAEPYFSLDFSPKNKTLIVSNPGKRRIEAFDADSGAWRKELSFDSASPYQTPNESDCSPASLHVLPNGVILTLETGTPAKMRNFTPEGAFLTEIDMPELVASDSGKIPLIAVGKSAAGKNHLLVLSASGQLILYPEPAF